MTPLTPSQFLDLASYIAANGKLSSFPGLDALRDCEEICGPRLAGDCDVIFLKSGWPYALYESFYGFHVVPFPVETPLTAEQFADLENWLCRCDTYSATLSLQTLCGCDLIERPLNIEAMSDSEQIYTRNGIPVALRCGDEGFYVLAAQ